MSVSADVCPPDGFALLRVAEQETGTDLAAFLAAATVWANPRVHAVLLRSDPLGLWYPGTRRYKRGAGERRGQVIDGIRLDDNTYANFALKNALPGGARSYDNYSVCHIWPDTCYDARCHTCIANLVLVPSPLMSITDYHPSIQAALKFRSWELYEWQPPGLPVPTKPERYPSTWRAPEPFTTEIESRLSGRGIRY
jgi:hypothetical protein